MTSSSVEAGAAGNARIAGAAAGVSGDKNHVGGEAQTVHWIYGYMDIWDMGYMDIWIYWIYGCMEGVPPWNPP